MTSNSINIKQAQESFVSIIRNLGDEDKLKFLEWINRNWCPDDAVVSSDSQEEILKCIAADIRNVLPPNSVLPSENISFPSVGENALLDPTQTIHVDAFLYDDELIDELCEVGKISRNFCLNCGSHSTKPLNFISHSASRERLLYIFTVLLGPLNEKVVLDVGSRLGAILYGAYLYSNSQKIIGIEINKDLCELQRGIVQKYGFQDRIQVMEGNLLDLSSAVNAADVIILNNVFEFFMPRELQVIMWHFLKSNIKRGALLVTAPALEVSMGCFKGEAQVIEVNQWVKEVPPFNTDSHVGESLQSELESVKLYQVI